MVHRSVLPTCLLRWTRGERVRLPLYFIYILWRLVITAFHRRPVKVDGSSFFHTITGTKVRFFFLFLLHGLAFPHFFSTFTTRPSISSLFRRPTGHESRCFSCQCRVKINKFVWIEKRICYLIIYWIFFTNFLRG